MANNSFCTRWITCFICATTLFLSSPLVRADVDTEAYYGQPYGVGRVTIDVLRGEPVLPLSDERFTLLEAQERVFYPALEQQPVRQFIRQLLGMEAPRKVTFYFLFRGETPFDLSVFTPYEQGVRVKPVASAAGHRDLLSKWWAEYCGQFESLRKSRAYPPIAENFLIASLSRRIGLEIPGARRGIFDSKSSHLEFLSTLFNGETRRLEIDRQLVLEGDGVTGELLELPPAPQWPAREVAAENEEVAFEQLASQVPAECFYVRFGNFPNYWWFRQLNKKWRGDLGNMVLQRGIQRSVEERLQQQISLRESALAEILGPQVIEDAALIGLDPYLQEGAAIGILFQAKNEFLLTTDLTQQRRSSLTKFSDAKEETLEIEGQEVSLISTPDGQVRSYYAKRDGFHLVSTSRTLVTRFLQAGQGEGSLAALPSFQRARRHYPLERDDTIFVFLSEKFGENLASPHYFVENRRRLRAAREQQIAQLALLAARCEGIEAQSTEQLAALGILPNGFGTRADGSHLTQRGEETVDSSRGLRGFYVPVADMAVEQISPTEQAAYLEFTKQQRASFPSLPAVAAAVKHWPGENGDNESISVDLHFQGSLRSVLGKAGTWLAQPADLRKQPVAGDVLSAEAVIEISSPLGGLDAAEHHLFGGLRDYRAPLLVRHGSLSASVAQSELVRGYLGAWPKPGVLGWFAGSDVTLADQPQRVGDELWQAKQDEFLLVSFKSDVIREVLPQLQIVPAQRPAQLWVRLEDLTNTLMAENVTALGYMRTRDTSAAGSRMMNALANQLHVPRDQCRELAEQLIDGKFVCPLGGEYQLYEPERGLETWASSALPAQNRFLLSEVPEDYQLPLLTWFRGFEGELRLGDRDAGLHVEVQMTKAALP